MNWQNAAAMDNRTVGFFIMGTGAALIVVGAVVWTGAFAWFGRLPGDIRIEKPGARVYAPIVSMLVLSVVFSVMMYLVRKLFTKGGE